MKRRRTVITFETTELFMGRGAAGSTCWCAVCEMETHMLSAEEAAAVAGVGVRDIYRMAESARLHFLEIFYGRLLICPRSLSQNGEGPDAGHAAASPQFRVIDAAKVETQPQEPARQLNPYDPHEVKE